MVVSHRRLLGEPLLHENTSAQESPAAEGRTAAGLTAAGLTLERLAKGLYVARCALLCHDASAVPRFTYANRAAQELFGRSWDQFIGLPSRLSAEPDHRELRAQMLSEVATAGFVRGYAGVRVDATGRRFAIEDATVWNVTTAEGKAMGQAARICQWRFMDANQA